MTGLRRSCPDLAVHAAGGAVDAFGECGMDVDGGGELAARSLWQAESCAAGG